MHERVEVNDTTVVNEARRQLSIQKRIKAHGGTGLPPDLDAIEACRRGACMQCGGVWGPLYLHIPDHYPGLDSAATLAKYREEFAIPEDVPLVADWHRQRLSSGQSKRMQGPQGTKIRSNLARKSAIPHPERYGKTGRKSLNKVAVSSWEIAKRLTQGVGLKNTMDEVGAPNHKLIQRRGEAMGLAFSTAFLCDLGEPFQYRDLFHLRKASGFEVADFDKLAGLSEGRSGATRPGEALMNPSEARKAIEWRDEVLRKLLKVGALDVAGRSYRKDEALRTFLPGLNELNRTLVLTMPGIRKIERENSGRAVAELCEEICKRAQVEQSASSEDYRWRKTLRYLWQAEDWLTKNLDRLRGPEDDGPLVREMIGSRFGATQQTVQNSLRDRTATISPVEMRLLVVTLAPSSAAARGGRRRGVKNADTEAIVRKAAALRLLDYSQRKMVPFLYPGQHNIDAGEKAVQKFLKRHAAAIERQKMTSDVARTLLDLPLA